MIMGVKMSIIVGIVLACFSNAQAEIPANGTCNIYAFTPFSNRDDMQNMGTLGSNFGVSQLAAAVLAAQHFNSRDPKVVPQLAEIGDCTITLDINKVFDAGIYNSDGIRWIKETEPCCAMAGPADDKTTRDISVLAQAYEVPLISTGSREPSAVDSMFNDYTSSVKADLAVSGRQIAKYLLWKDRNNYIAFLYDYSQGNFQRREVLGAIFDESGVEWMSSSFNLGELIGEADKGRSDNVRSVRNALKAIKERGYRTIIIALSEPYLSMQELADAAEEFGMNNGDYFWLFYDDSFAPSIFKLGNKNVTKVMAGSAWVEAPPLRYIPGIEDPFSETYSKQGPDFARQVAALLPVNPGEPGYVEIDDDYFQGKLPEIGAELMYDAIISIGLGACLAQEQVSEGSVISGASHQTGIRRMTFLGASGQVDIGSPREGSAGSRNPRGLKWACVNPLQDLQYNIPEFVSGEGEWEKGGDGIAPFVYADGSNNPPPRLRDEPNQNYLSGALRSVGFALMGTVFVTAIASGVWTYRNRKHRLVAASQPEFLYLICFGAMIQTSTIAPVSFDESYGWDQQQLDRGCMAMPWLLAIGHIMIYSALFTKLWRINKVLQFTRRKIEIKQVVGPMAGLVVSAIVILILWTVLDPFKWTREEINDFTGESIGSCESKDTIAYVLPLIIVMLIPALLTAIMAHKTKDVDEAYTESSWIFIMIILQMEVVMVAAPVVVILRDVSSDGKYLGLVFMLWTFPMTALALIFFPKMAAHRRAVLGLNEDSYKRGSKGNARVSGLVSPVQSSTSHASYQSSTPNQSGRRLVPSSVVSETIPEEKPGEESESQQDFSDSERKQDDAYTAEETSQPMSDPSREPEVEATNKNEPEMEATKEPEVAVSNEVTESELQTSLNESESRTLNAEEQ